MAKQSAASMTQLVRVLALCTLYITASALLIRFNKFLMSPSRFPFAIALATFHAGCAIVFSGLLYLCMPWAFSGVAAAHSRESRRKLLSWFAPISLLFAVSVAASNEAYVYCNVAFLQFMKEGNVVISFLMSCALGLQVMDRLRAANIMWIVAGSMICVSSELNFVLVGFAIQLVSQLAECSRAVVADYIFQDFRYKLDPLSYMFFISPLAFVTLLWFNLYHWDPEVLVRAKEWWPYLLPNACLAFALNLIVAAVIKEVSAVGFMLVGVTKDIVLVLVSATLFHETVVLTQWISFVLVTCGILFWSFMKVEPNHPVILRMEAFLGMQLKGGAPTERTSLALSRIPPAKV